MRQPHLFGDILNIAVSFYARSEIGDAGCRQTVLDPIVKPIVPLAMADGLADFDHIRRNAEKYAVQSNRVGIMGFSAGGTVAASVGFNDTNDNRPDFIAPI